MVDRPTPARGGVTGRFSRRRENPILPTPTRAGVTGSFSRRREISPAYPRARGGDACLAGETIRSVHAAPAGGGVTLRLSRRRDNPIMLPPRAGA